MHKTIILAGLAIMMAGFACRNPAIIPQPAPPGTTGKHGQTFSQEEYRNLSRGRELYINKCSGCHYLYGADQYGDGEWRMWLEEMREKANINSEEERLIGDFLLRYNE